MQNELSLGKTTSGPGLVRCAEIEVTESCDFQCGSFRRARGQLEPIGAIFARGGAQARALDLEHGARHGRPGGVRDLATQDWMIGLGVRQRRGEQRAENCGEQGEGAGIHEAQE